MSNLGNSNNLKLLQFMSILSKDTIITEILPHLTHGSKGRKLSQNKRVIIVQLILYRLKTGCQWRELPIKQFSSKPYSWQSVFHHFNQWSKNGCWQKVWENFLRSNKHYLDMSSTQIDGTHTPVKRGGEAVGYQGRKSSKTTNSLCISDANGVLLAASQPEAGNHHDLYEIQKHFQEMTEMLDNVNINQTGIFLNADAGFDSQELRDLCFQPDISPNFCLNSRNGKVTERDVHFDEQLYEKRQVIEHSFAWLDAFKALLVRFEKLARNWFSLMMIGFLVIFNRKITPN